MPRSTDWQLIRTASRPRAQRGDGRARGATASSAAYGAGAGAGAAADRRRRAARGAGGPDRRSHRPEVLDVAGEVARAEVDPVAAGRRSTSNAPVYSVHAPSPTPVLGRHDAGAVAVGAGERDADGAGVLGYGRGAVDPRGRDGAVSSTLRRSASDRLVVAGDVGRAELDSWTPAVLDRRSARRRPPLAAVDAVLVPRHAGARRRRAPQRDLDRAVVPAGGAERAPRPAGGRGGALASTFSVHRLVGLGVAGAVDRAVLERVLALAAKSNGPP